MPDNGNVDVRFLFDRYEMRPGERILSSGGHLVHLTPRVYDLLEQLVRNAGSVVTKEHLLDTVWAGTVVEEGNINRTMSTLRRKLGRQLNGNDFIETVPKVGYRLLAKVTENIVHGASASGSLHSVWPFRRYRPVIVAALVITFLGLIFALVVLRTRISPGVLKIEKNVPIRLTSSDTDETKPEFTSDGRIRFFRGSSYVMDADGTNVRRESSITGLHSGYWSPDGSRVIYYKDGDAGTTYIAGADGSGETRLPFNFGNCQWSRDGARFLFQKGTRLPGDGGVNSDIYIYDINTGAIETIVDGPSFDGDPSFAPDGNSILFVSNRDGNFEIYSKKLRTNEIRRLTFDPAHDAFPSYSPDGTQILFTSERDENSDIFIMNADGSDVRKVTDLPSNEAAFGSGWSADGTRILLVSDASGKDNIYLMNIEPFKPKIVFTDMTEDIVTAAPVPGGDKFLTAISKEQGRFEIWLRNETGGLARKIASACSPKFSISPDGSQVVFVDRVEKNSEIFTAPINGGEPRNLTNHPDTDAAPSWSPDGKRIVFVSNRGDNRSAFGIYTVNADGTDTRGIYYANSFAHFPVYSADGKRIIFNDDKIGERSGNFEILSIDAESGGDERRLTYRSKFDVQPTVSPDGKYIAFVSNLDGNSEIYLMNSDGSGIVRITRDPADDAAPVFSDDGRTLFFCSDRGGKRSIYKVAVHE